MACTCQPGKGLCDSCLKSVYERNKTGQLPTVNSRGEFTKAQVEVFEKQFRDNIVEDIQNGPLAVAVKRYPDFYEAVKEINTDFLQRPYIQNQLPDYPVLNKRLEKGPISALEFAAFIKESNYTPATAIESSNAKGSRFLRELEYYYNGDFADSVMGGFCGLFNNIFAAIDAFFDIIGAIDGFIQDVFSFLTKIRNIKDEVLAFFESLKVKALIEAIKEKVAEMVEKAIQKVCQSIANFDVTAIVGDIPFPTPAQTQMCQKVESEKSALQEICGEDAAAAIKAKIQGLIDYAVGLFSNPSIEEIFALISRICGMAAGIEGLFKKLKDPLNNFADRYDEVFNTMSNASNRVTGEAIRAGAIRPSEEQRQEMINNARRVWEERGNPPPPSTREISGVPSWEQIKDNTHDKIRIQGGWVTGMRPASDGWNKLDGRVKIMIMRLQEKAKAEGIISSYLILNSGYRSPAYNEALRARGIGAAKNSQHLQGNACDLTWPGFKPRGEKNRRFAQLAQEVGFKGFGYYNSFIHCDIGPRRSWDKRS